MDRYFEETYRRDCKKVLANYVYQIINNFSGNHNRIWAFVIKAIHFKLLLITMLIYLFGPIWFSVVTLIIALGCWGLFLYLKGCFLSIVEYKLDGDNFVNVIDPYLAVMGYPIDQESRYAGTLQIVWVYFSLAFVILYIRLHH